MKRLLQELQNEPLKSNVVFLEGKKANSERFARRKSKNAANEGRLLKEAADHQKYMSMAERRLLKERN